MHARAMRLFVASLSATLCLSAQIRADREITNPTPAELYHMQRSELLNKNTLKLHISVQLDRTVYLPGELAEITISVANNTGTALEALAPFTAFVGTMGVSALRTLARKTSW